MWKIGEKKKTNIKWTKCTHITRFIWLLFGNVYRSKKKKHTPHTRIVGYYGLKLWGVYTRQCDLLAQRAHFLLQWTYKFTSRRRHILHYYTRHAAAAPSRKIYKIRYFLLWRRAPRSRSIILHKRCGNIRARASNNVDELRIYILI